MVKSLKALLLFASAALFAATVWANTTLFIEISWNYDDADADPPPNLGPGSIVQIIGRTHEGVLPENAGPNGGMQQYGTSDNLPVLLPETVKDGWTILETAHVQQISGGYYSVSVAIEVPANIESVFVRVFSVTNFPLAPEAYHGYWGISAASNVTETIGTGYTWFDDVKLNHEAYFEVIPEPATVALLGSGLLAIAFRRKRKSSLDVSDHSSHDEGGLQ